MLHAGSEPAFEAADIEKLAAVERKRLAVHAARELQRQHAHADEIGAMDALERFGDHRAHAEQRAPLAAQSREEPAPYSAPATMTSGTPSPR